MELKVEEIQDLEPVKFNFKEIKTELTRNLEKYKNLVYTEENIKVAKADRALLNKLSKAINDEKIRIKNKLLEPGIAFENQCKELMRMVNEVTAGIDTQVKAFEEIEKKEKKQQIIDCWLENAGEFQELIGINLIFNDSWLNKTYTLKKVETDIKHIIEKAKMDLTTIDGQIKDEVINKQVKDFYFKNINQATVLSLSLQEGARIAEANQKLDTLEKSQNITKNTANITNNSQNITNCQEKITKNKELKRMDFSVEITFEQMTLLKEFCVKNNIKVLRGITEQDVLCVVEDIDEYIQNCREEGETDLRGIICYTQSILSSINEVGTRKVVKDINKNKENESEDK